ncbi:hypothetical protein NDN08_007269 [Rhodosorus marinus]|uniref:Uncharacterized protein n=1 Tax=Rhodosorus marinus TaxID=101924 RepID=A0AAV8UIR2_9RHOD|nr:hypothetical protein NDN08_007269 [Rhodosorus marinus]
MIALQALQRYGLAYKVFRRLLASFTFAILVESYGSSVLKFWSGKLLEKGLVYGWISCILSIAKTFAMVYRQVLVARQLKS